MSMSVLSFDKCHETDKWKNETIKNISFFCVYMKAFAQFFSFR